MVLVMGAGLSGSSSSTQKPWRADPKYVPTSDFFLHLCSKPFTEVRLRADRAWCKRGSFQDERTDMAFSFSDKYDYRHGFVVVKLCNIRTDDMLRSTSTALER